MPIVNLDVVAPTTVDLRRDGEVRWQLAADVPAAVMIRVLYLGELEAENVAEDLAAFVEEQHLSMHESIAELERRAVERQRKIEAETLRIFTNIWRWTYPLERYADMSDEWLASTFDHRERYQIVDAFFAMRSGRSATASNEPTPTSSAPDSAPVETTSNRAARRAARTRSGKRSSSSGGAGTARTRSATPWQQDESVPPPVDPFTAQMARMTLTVGTPWQPDASYPGDPAMLMAQAAAFDAMAKARAS